jgi:ADP-heptose:LPS heptosyltransferase
LFIGNDSGMMHLSATVDTPVVGIFGPGNPATSGPQLPTEKKVLVTKEYSCSPCRQRFFKECEPSANNKPFCLEDIQVEDVFNAAERILQLPMEQE